MIRTIESHIIQKQSIEINFEEVDAAVDMQHRVAELFHERLQPAMNKLFDEMVGTDRSAVIEHLEIDCGTLSAKAWEDEWLERVIRNLRAQLREVNKSPVNKHSKAAESFFFFLKQGVFPWNGNYSTTGELEDLIVVDGSFMGRLKESVLSNSSARKRLLLQFSRKFKQRLIAALQEPDEAANLFREKSQELDSNDFEDLPDADKLLLKLIDRKNSGKEIKSDNGSGQGKMEDTEKHEHEHATTLYVNNAGLILLHPFLPTLFGRLNLTKDDNWINENATHKAMLILQLLVDGESAFPEYELPLNKILCNWPLTEPVDQEIDIDADTRSECNGLLEEVIRQWARLKNSGINALRETFLQRVGKLTRISSGWLLQVEQKTVDVLLGGLPWGISIIKLPWMDEIVYVEWI